MAHFDDDHRKRENVCFLVVCPLRRQDLRCSPSRDVDLTRGAWRGTEVLGDHSETKTRDAHMTGIVHKDV